MVVKKFVARFFHFGAVYDIHSCMPYSIYIVENTINHKKYIGYTSQSLKKRFSQHASSKKPIGNAIKKYGKSHFTISLIEMCDTMDSALEQEKKWISYHKSFEEGYNCSRGGESSPKVRNKMAHSSPEFKDKVRKNAINQHSDPSKKETHIQGIRKYWNNLTEDEKNIRRKIAIENGKKSTIAWNKGRKFPGTGMTGDKHPMSKHYRVWFPDGTEITIYCLSSFCKKNSLTYRCACGVLEGKQKHHKGFRFARLENHS